MVAMTPRFLMWLLLLDIPCLAVEDSGKTADWQTHLKAAQQLQLAGNVTRAEREFQAALQAAKQVAPDGKSVAYVLGAIGTYYEQIGNFREAERCFLQSLAIWQRILGPDHFALARVISQLASVYLETGQLAKAQSLRLESWVRRAEAQPPSSELEKLLENVAALDALRGHFAEAEKVLAHDLDVTAQRNDLVESAVILNNLGLVCFDSGRYSDAIRYLSRSLVRWEGLRSANDPNSALISHSLALAYEAEGRYASAVDSSGSRAPSDKEERPVSGLAIVRARTSSSLRTAGPRPLRWSIRSKAAEHFRQGKLRVRFAQKLVRLRKVNQAVRACVPMPRPESDRVERQNIFDAPLCIAAALLIELREAIGGGQDFDHGGRRLALIDLVTFRAKKTGYVRDRLPGFTDSQRQFGSSPESQVIQHPAENHLQARMTFASQGFLLRTSIDQFEVRLLAGI